MQEDPSALLEVLQMLDEALRQAGEMNKHAKSPSQQRLAAICALHGCIEFVWASNTWRAAGLAAVLQVLAMALLDLDNGRTAPMLRAKGKSTGGGPAISEAEAVFRAHAAYVMHGLMKYGRMSKTKAAQWVADALGARKYKVSFHTIIDWRNDANGRKNQVTGRSFRFVQERDQPAYWADPLGRARDLMEKIIFPPQKVE